MSIRASSGDVTFTVERISKFGIGAVRPTTWRTQETIIATDTKSLALCAYQGCTRSGEIATLIIEIGGGRLERRICDRHLSMAPAITQEHQGLAYHLIPFQW
jgi:hypothetical protein